jgi:hypothetical protein
MMSLALFSLTPSVLRLSNSLEYTHYEFHSFLAIRQISRILLISMIHYLISHEPASWLYPEPAESIRRHPLLFKILSSAPVSIRFSHGSPMCLFLRSRACQMPNPTHPL